MEEFRMIRFPHCCVAKLLIGFGETDVTDIADGAEYNPDVLQEEILKRVRKAREEGNAVLIATTNDEQEIANEVLEETGFYSSEWMEKDKHPETKVKLWWKALKQENV